MISSSVPANTTSRRPSLLRRWRSNQSGATAIEFAMVATPFFMFAFGIIGIGLHFFTTNALEHGVEAAARKIRTGQAQSSSMTVGQFKTSVCSSAGSFIDCNKLYVHVQHATNWRDLQTTTCLDGSRNFKASTGTSAQLIKTHTGDANEVVMITLCYQWDLITKLAFLKLGKNTDGSGPAVLQALTAFRSEPFS